MSSFAQRSLAAGEIDPALHARVDQTRYATGVKTMRNNTVRKSGGSRSRAGTKFICEVKDSSKTVRLVPFEYNDSDTYMLEFGDQYMRVIRNGGQVLEAAQNITAITQANPAVVTVASHGYSNGQEVYLTGILGMTQLNGRNFKVANATTNTFSLQYMDGTAVNSSAFSAYASGGTAARVYTLSTPYVEADLLDLGTTSRPTR